MILNADVLKSLFLHKAQLYPVMANKKKHFASKRCFLWATDKSLGAFISKCISCQHLSESSKITHYNKYVGHIHAFSPQDQGLKLRESGTFTEMCSPVDVVYTARPSCHTTKVQIKSLQHRWRTGAVDKRDLWALHNYSLFFFLSWGDCGVSVMTQ